MNGRKRAKRQYIIALMAAIFLCVAGCGKEADAEPVQVIGFDELDTEGIASWSEDISGEHNADADVQEEPSGDTIADDTDANEEFSGTIMTDTTNAGVKEGEDGIWFCMDKSVSDHPLYAQFLESEVTAVDQIPVKDETIKEMLGFDWSGEEFYLQDFYKKLEEKTSITGGFNGIQVFGRDLDGDGTDELIVLIEYYLYSELCGVMYPFHEENGTLYAWEELLCFREGGNCDFYENGVIYTTESYRYVKYDQNGEVEPILYYYETPTNAGLSGHWGKIDCDNKLIVYENGEEDTVIKYEYEYWVSANEEIISPEDAKLRKECETIVNEFKDALGEGRYVAAMSNYHRVGEFAARVTLNELCYVPAEFHYTERQVYYASYLIDDEVRDNDFFLQFVNNEIPAYEMVEGIIRVPEAEELVAEEHDNSVDDVEWNRNTEGETVFYEKEIYVTAVYGEYRTDYPVYYTDKCWYAIDEVRFSAKDLDGDGKDELLMLVGYGESVEDLHVFHEENGKLYRWETMEDMSSNLNDSKLYIYDNGIIGFVGVQDAKYVRYNPEGEIEPVFTVDTGRRPNGRYEFSGIYFIGYNLIEYENGIQTKVLYYEDKHLAADDSYKSTSDVFIKDEYQKTLTSFMEDLGVSEVLEGAKDRTAGVESLNVAEVAGGYRLEKLEQGDLLRLFMDGEIPAYDRETDDNGIPFYESPFYVAEIYSGVEIKYKYTQLDDDEDYELVIQGPYGGIYLDARNGTVYVMACGQGTGCVLSYAEYDGLKWLVYSDTTHSGRKCYHFYRMDYTGAVVEEFTLNKFYWDYPQEPDGPNTVYEYNDEPISKEEYNAILEQIEITKTSWWYGE